MSSEDTFGKITAAITANEKYENVVHDVCHMPHVTNLKQFYRIYELEGKAFDEKYDNQPKFAPTIELYEEVFKKFEEYPANLQKLKKHLHMRERFNSNMSRSSPSLNDSIGLTTTNKENSMSLLNLNKFDDIPTASETFNNFVKFQKQIEQLYAEIMQHDLEMEYVGKLKQLNIFSQQLEKLLHTEKAAKPALTSDEETILEDLVNRMNDLNSILNHHNGFRKQNGLTNSNVAPKLDSLVDTLSYCLLAVTSFNIN